MNQLLLIPPGQGRRKHPDRGYRHERTAHSDLEAAFAALWEEENRERPGINYGTGLLQDLFINDNRTVHHEVTDSERYVAATVVQWLGTNCGFSFLIQALRRAGYVIEEIKPPKPEPPKIIINDQFVLRRPKLT